MDLRINSLDEASKKRIRVILRPDGHVHIAFDSSTSILATGRAVMDLFQDPIGLLEEGCLRYQETTGEICRKGKKIIPLENILGLDLAYVTVQHQVVCDFTELFRGLFSRIGHPNLDMPLNMWDMVCDPSKTTLPDDKALLLRYYLEVSKFLSEKELPPVKRSIKLQDEVKLAVVQVALNAFAPTKHKGNKIPSLSECLKSLEAQATVPDIVEEENKDPNLIGTKECSRILGITSQQVRNMINSGEIKATRDSNGQYIIDKQSLPTKQKRRNKKKSEQEKLSGSYEEVQRIIWENHYFTEAVAPYIHSMTEMMFFAQSHRETVIDGRPALILDIFPEFVTQDGRTNRQRIMDDNESPICPTSPDGKPFHIHHMARRADAPFAIVSLEDHQAYNKIFHQTPKDPNMDRPTFDMQRISFWKSYLQLYDQYGYDRIPYLNEPIDQKKK